MLNQDKEKIMANKIIPLQNGSLEVVFDENVLFYEDKLVEAQSGTHLCRCGASRNKPFCDGTHRKIGFSSNKDIHTEILQVYEGKDITVHFNRSICAGAGECVRGLATVFKSGNAQNWIYPDNECKEKIIETIKSCPSGALSYDIDNQHYFDQCDSAKVDIVQNGPYAVQGFDLQIKEQPTHMCSTKYTLCRCGHSKNKPFCDYSHARDGWVE